MNTTRHESRASNATSLNGLRWSGPSLGRWFNPEADAAARPSADLAVARTTAAPADRIRFDCLTVYPVAQLSSACPAIRIQPSPTERKVRSVQVHSGSFVIHGV